MNTARHLRVCSMIALSLAFGASGCGKSKSSASAVNNCVAPAGSPWVPAVTGVGSSNHNSAITVTQTTQTVAAPVSGWNDGAAPGRLVTVTIPMHNDLGPLGSLSLSAQASNPSVGLQGGLHPLLVSLNDGTNEYINLTLSGGSDCAGSGFYVLSGGKPVANPSCKINAPSAYQDFAHWSQYQLRLGPSSSGVPSDNESFSVFPTCNWTGGAAGQSLNPNCAFNSTFFSGTPARLRFGPSVTYTAKYFIMADSYSSLTGINASLQVTAVTKSNSSGTLGGAVDLNVILVGSQNVNDSRTPKGQQNLNLLLQSLLGVYTQTATDPVSHAAYSPGVKIGTVNVVEWGCDAGGDAYATVDPSAASGSSPELVIQTGSAALPANGAGKTINIFLVQQFTDPKILGIDGNIGGSLLNGNPSSGMLVATLGKLGTFNPNCTLSSCPVSSQEQDFVQMGPTIAHEMGHFFGLNHPDEGDASMHDIVLDTPMHTATHYFPGYGLILQNDYVQAGDTNPYMGTGNTCSQACPSYNSGATQLHPAGAAQQFCPAVFECGFNHLMWWTGKYYSADNTQSDGNLISLDSSYVINYNPYLY